MPRSDAELLKILSQGFGRKSQHEPLSAAPTRSNLDAHSEPVGRAMTRADVDGGATFYAQTNMAAITDAGIKLDATTDADLGEDVCRAVCNVADQDGDIITSYRVEFFQTTLAAALSGSAPSWQSGSLWYSEQNNGSAARLRHVQARAIASLFSAEQRGEISEYERELSVEADERPPEQWPEHNPYDDEDPGPEGRP